MNKEPSPAMAQRVCRCEATIPASILDGYACGRPDCWRTGEVEASFAQFVGELVRKRGDARSSAATRPSAIEPG